MKVMTANQEIQVCEQLFWIHKCKKLYSCDDNGDGGVGDSNYSQVMVGMMMMMMMVLMMMVMVAMVMVTKVG